MSTTNRIGAVAPQFIRSVFVGTEKYVAPDAAVRVTLTADGNADTNKASVVLDGAKLRPPMSPADLANVASVSVPQPWGTGGEAKLERLPRGVLRLETGVMGAAAWLKAPPMVEVTMKDGTGRLLQLEPSTIGHNRGPFELKQAQEQIRTLGQIIAFGNERVATYRELLRAPELLPKGLLVDLAEEKARLDGIEGEINTRITQVEAALSDAADPARVHMAIVSAKALTGRFPAVTTEQAKQMVAEAKADPALWAKVLVEADTLFFRDAQGHGSQLLRMGPKGLEAGRARLSEREAEVPERRAAEVKQLETELSRQLVDLAERNSQLEKRKKEAATLSLSPSIVTAKTEYP